MEASRRGTAVALSGGRSAAECVEPGTAGWRTVHSHRELHSRSLGLQPSRPLLRRNLGLDPMPWRVVFR